MNLRLHCAEIKDLETYLKKGYLPFLGMNKETNGVYILIRNRKNDVLMYNFESNTFVAVDHQLLN